ncbi:hypothetical protein [Melittangium boletus]|uniref:hypothetical protein n=1 Tax=Melittangium boletus TaxID=83453 RepID=UPI003DA5DF04
MGASVLALMIAACGGQTFNPEPLAPSEMQGTLQLPLTSTGPEGTSYKLVGATFEITGPQSVSITDTSADTLNVPLSVGAYSITIGGDYHLERTSAPGTVVPAELISDTTLTFDVAKDTPTQVRFLFKLAGSGSADVGFSVENGGFIRGTLSFSDANAPEGSPFSALVGKDIPFTLSYGTATVSKNGWRELRVETGPISLQFGGPDSAALTRNVAPAFAGRLLSFSLRGEPDGRVVFMGFSLQSRPEQGFDFRIDPSQPFQAPVDTEGFPRPGSFQFQGAEFPGSARLQGPLAYGSVQGRLTNGKGSTN